MKPRKLLPWLFLAVQQDKRACAQCGYRAFNHILTPSQRMRYLTELGDPYADRTKRDRRRRGWLKPI